MKQITEYLSNKIVQTKIKATNETIHKIVKDELDRLGHDADLNHIDVSEVTNMESLFNTWDGNATLGNGYEDFNPDISKWNVSNVENMQMMFKGCKIFNRDLSQWDVRKVEDMGFMFSNCENFNQDLSKWDVRKVEDMRFMFSGCKKFNKDISKWDVSNVKIYYYMFYECPIKQKFKPKFK